VTTDTLAHRRCEIMPWSGTRNAKFAAVALYNGDRDTFVQLNGHPALAQTLLRQIPDGTGACRLLRTLRCEVGGHHWTRSWSRYLIAMARYLGRRRRGSSTTVQRFSGNQRCSRRLRMTQGSCMSTVATRAPRSCRTSRLALYSEGRGPSMHSVRDSREGFDPGLRSDCADAVVSL